MRYRGGGIGHKYMWEIEKIYENMSRERTHHKERRHTGPSDQDVMDIDDESGSDDECEPVSAQSQADQQSHPGGQHRTSNGPGNAANERRAGGNGGGDNDEGDEDKGDKGEGDDEGEGDNEDKEGDEDDEGDEGEGSEGDDEEEGDEDGSDAPGSDSDDMVSEDGCQEESYGLGGL